MNEVLTPWKRFFGLLQLERKAIVQIFYYAVFSGLVALTLPLGIQAIVNLIQGAQISTSWIVLVVLVTLGVVFSGALKLMQLRIIENIQQKVFTRAPIDSTEAGITVNDRKLQIEKYKLELNKKALELSNFLWLENNIPLELQENII